MEPLETMLTKEIERLRADKVALVEMLTRAKEYISIDSEDFDLNGDFITRIDTLLARMG